MNRSGDGRCATVQERDKTMSITKFVITIIVLIAVSGNATATVVEYVNKAAWQNDAVLFTTIRFNDFPDGTIITDQYATLGVTVTTPTTFILNLPTAFPNDGFGLVNPIGQGIGLTFSQPMKALAVDYPGIMQITLYSGGNLIFAGPASSGGGSGFFAGVISDVPFDAALLNNPTVGVVNIDDLYFGPPIPGPGVLGVFVVAAVVVRRRRN